MGVAEHKGAIGPNHAGQDEGIAVMQNEKVAMPESKTQLLGSRGSHLKLSYPQLTRFRVLTRATKARPAAVAIEAPKQLPNETVEQAERMQTADSWGLLLVPIVVCLAQLIYAALVG